MFEIWWTNCDWPSVMAVGLLSSLYKYRSLEHLIRAKELLRITKSKTGSVTGSFLRRRFPKSGSCLFVCLFWLHFIPLFSLFLLPFSALHFFPLSLFISISTLFCVRPFARPSAERSVGWSVVVSIFPKRGGKFNFHAPIPKSWFPNLSFHRYCVGILGRGGE